MEMVYYLSIALFWPGDIVDQVDKSIIVAAILKNLLTIELKSTL
jgi:hypothetical protein